jgi:hypothetical protein
MNISSTSGHRWYSQLCQQCVVLLDGVKLHYVITASEEEGWVEQFDITEIGDREKDLPVKRTSGKVEILLIPQVSRVITPNFLRVAKWLTLAGKEVGNPAHISVQVGCMLEEVAEFLHELVTPDGSVSDLIAAYESLSHLASQLKRGRAVAFDNPVAALDALCDIDVTINGVAFLAGWNKCLADIAVLNANDDKFEDGVPVFLEGGKIGKRAGWEAPDLSEFVQRPETSDEQRPA